MSCSQQRENWLIGIPDHWNSTPLKYIANFRNGHAFKPSEWTESGIAIIRIENLNGSQKFNFHQGSIDQKFHIAKGDLLFGWSGNRGTSFGPFIWGKRGLFYLNQHIFLVQTSRADKGWLYWALKALTQVVEEEAHGIIGMVHITKFRLGSLRVPSVPYDEQLLIAKYLHAEVARVDTIISKQEKLIELLKERRHAVITQAVTKGLNPTVPMQGSGIQWLGEIPEHWMLKNIRRLLKSIEQGFSPVASAVIPASGERGVLKLSAIKNGRFDWKNSKALQSEYDYIPSCEVRNGDLLVTRANTINLVADAAVVRETPPGIMLSDLVYRIVLTGEVTPEFLCYWLISSAGRQQIEEDARGSNISMSKVSQSQIRSWLTVVPPLKEQVSICRKLRERTEAIFRADQSARRMISLLQERRAALITAAVTGQIDVSSYKPSSEPAPT